MYWPFPFPNEGSFHERPARMRDLEPDERLTMAVAARLLLDDRTGAVSITPRAQHGVVILTGSVRTGEARRLAGEIAATTAGARDVCNAIHVVPHRRVRARVLKALLLVAAYASLLGGVFGAHIALIHVALLCAVGLSVCETHALRRRDVQR